MKLVALVLALLIGLLPAAALIGGQTLMALGWIPAVSMAALFGWSLVGSAIFLALLVVLLMDFMAGQGRTIILVDKEGKIRSIGPNRQPSPVDYRRFGIVADDGGKVRGIEQPGPSGKSA